MNLPNEPTTGRTVFLAGALCVCALALVLTTCMHSGAALTADEAAAVLAQPSAPTGPRGDGGARPALETLRARALSGDPGAAHRLAVAHARGVDGVRNAPQAARWYLRAANMGVPAAQYDSGLIALRGARAARAAGRTGQTDRLLLRAAAWFMIAGSGAGGLHSADSRLAELREEFEPDDRLMERARELRGMWAPCRVSWCWDMEPDGLPY